MMASYEFSKRLLEALKLDHWVVDWFELKSQSLTIKTSGCAQLSVNGERFWFPFPYEWKIRREVNRKFRKHLKMKTKINENEIESNWFKVYT